MARLDYNDVNLQRMYEELQPRRRVQAFRSAFRKEANKVRKTAVSNLRGSGLRTDRSLEKGVRAIVYRKSLGFRVTVGEKRGKSGQAGLGFHANRFGLAKPVLRWAEGGTSDRSTKSGYRRGSMPGYGFMSRTLTGVQDTVADDLHLAVTESVIKTAAKYGCRKG